MAKNRNQPDNRDEERNAPNRGAAGSSRQASDRGRTEEGTDVSREASKGGAREGREGGRSESDRGETGEPGSGRSPDEGTERGRSASGTGRQDESARQGQGRQAPETEGLDVDVDLEEEGNR